MAENLLKKKLKVVTEEEAKPTIELLKQRVEEFIKQGNGCYGLAANQIGIDAAVAYAKINDKEIILINPEIKITEDPIINKNEGCMSFPGQRVSTKRFNSVCIKNHKGELEHFFGLEAIIVGHELDHINGITIFDRDINPYPKLGRNDLCGCGSKIKTKYCCNCWPPSKVSMNRTYEEKKK